MTGKRKLQFAFFCFNLWALGLACGVLACRVMG